MKRIVLLALLWAGPVWAKRPESVPPHSFAVRLPAEWVSPAPDQWSSPDGTISLVWSEVALKKPPEQWAAEAQKHFPGPLLNRDLKLQMGGQPAWLYVGQHGGRIQRVYLTARSGRGVALVCTCNPSQNFAATALVQEIVDSFRWLP